MSPVDDGISGTAAPPAGAGRGARSLVRAGCWLLAAGAGLGLAAPPAGAVGAVGAARSVAECTAGTGPYQRQLEEYLERPVDGVQSPEDCTAIRAFQEAERIAPADGYANLLTYRVMTAVRARADPNAAGLCPDRTYRVTCIDLDRQLLWVQRGGKVLFDPVPVRSGRDGEETRTGWHVIYWRNKDHVSTLYDNAPMPYAQFFDGGQALHGRPDDLFDGGGSAGCVNLRLDDAAVLWDLLAVDDTVYVWGTKPGTGD
jgi:hypothetical protein